MKPIQIKLSVLTACLMLLSVSLPVSGQTAAQISKRSAEAADIGPMEMDLTVFIRDSKGNERVRQITMSSGKFGDVGITLIRFTAPADVKGTLLLIYDHPDKDDDMWIFMPALKKVRRIISSEKGKSFMGSEFTNADMSKPNQADFNYTLLGTVEYNGNTCWKIETTGIDTDIQKASGYSKTVRYIDQKNYVSHRVEYYDFSGNLHRIQHLSDYKEQTGKTYFAHRMVMENVQNKRVSEMIVNRLQMGTDLSENAFSPTALR
ncbi:MAG: outer membrane lipoprotein-sorting protein [Bacteroidales bacterium]|nr:outer membrane lipoprotein-sorting protein [Bacteroidales bacterium]